MATDKAVIPVTDRGTIVLGNITSGGGGSGGEGNNMGGAGGGGGSVAVNIIETQYICYFGSAGLQKVPVEGDQLVSLPESVALSKGMSTAERGNGSMMMQDCIQLNTHTSHIDTVTPEKMMKDEDELSSETPGKSAGLLAALSATAIQITFTLTLKNAPIIEESAQNVVLSKVAWQVLNIDNQPNRPFKIQFPSYIGFGTVEILDDDDSETVHSHQFLCGPPGCLVTLEYQSGPCWVPSSRLSDGNYMRAENQTGVPRRIALGSYNASDQKPEGLCFKPFLVTSGIPHEHTLCAEPQLILQAYKTQGFRAGEILTESMLSASECIFDADGIGIVRLQPTTMWQVKPKSGGGITLEIESMM